MYSQHLRKEEKATLDEEILAQWTIFHQDPSILELKSRIQRYFTIMDIPWDQIVVTEAYLQSQFQEEAYNQ